MKLICFNRKVFAALALVCLTSDLAFGAEIKPALIADPQANAILIRHLQAVGGEAASHKITSRRITDTLERYGNKVPIIRTQKAPKGCHSCRACLFRRAQNLIVNNFHSRREKKILRLAKDLFLKDEALCQGVSCVWNGFPRVLRK